mmetsp:Transcript_22437/g.29097  ORF Transcript_22437/g.29097 Transcript_22437/m.29097 type:complete len:397 (-) Transcript_22437:203-1393(-)
MANRTDPLAKAVHGTNPQNLVEKILRMKIYGARYWKEECFGLTAETLVDKAMDLKYIGGTYGGNRKPTKLLCLILKMLQLQPEKEIIIEFIKNEDYKYVRALGAFYLRLVGKPADIYQYLEPLYNDYRKLCFRNIMGWEIKHMDEFIDVLLREEYSCDLALPHLPKRQLLEDALMLEPRRSALEEDWEDDDDLDPDEDEEEDYDEDDVRKYVEARYKKLNITKTSDKGRLEAAIAAGMKGDERDLSESPSRGKGERSRKDKRKDKKKDRDRGRERDREKDHDRERDRDNISRRDRRRSKSHERSRRDRKFTERKRSRSRDRKKRRHRSKSRDRRNRSSSRARDREQKPRKEKKNITDSLFKKNDKERMVDDSPEKKDDTEYWNDMRAKLGLKPLKS